MSWFVTLFFLISLTFTTSSEASHEKKLQPAVVIGKVYCETCFQDAFSKSSHFISGNHFQMQIIYVSAHSRTEVSLTILN